MWVPLLEKAFAKYFGNYSHTIAGDPNTALQTMQGGPGFSYYFDNDHTPSWISRYNDETSLEDTWNLLVKHTAAKDLMTMWTPGKSDSYMNKFGLYNRHAFTVLGGVELADGTRLVKIRNPHGKENYKGPWGDTDPVWTDALLEEANKLLGEDEAHVLDVGDAQFWMPFTDTEENLGGYYGSVKGLLVNPDVTGWHSDYFLRLDDDGTDTTEAKFYDGNR